MESRTERDPLLNSKKLTWDPARHLRCLQVETDRSIHQRQC